MVLIYHTSLIPSITTDLQMSDAFPAGGGVHADWIAMQAGGRCRLPAEACSGDQCGYRAVPGFSGVFPGGFAAVTASLRSDRSERTEPLGLSL